MAININNAVIKEWENKTLKEIAAAPVHALQGISEEMASKLAEVGIKTVADLGNWKYAQWARAITTLAEREG